MQTSLPDTIFEHSFLFDESMMSAELPVCEPKTVAESIPVRQQYLELATAAALNVLDIVTDAVGISVPAAYLKVKGDSSYLVSIFIKQNDFLSPRRLAARRVADEVSAM